MQRTLTLFCFLFWLQVLNAQWIEHPIPTGFELNIGMAKGIGDYLILPGVQGGNTSGVIRRATDIALPLVWEASKPLSSAQMDVTNSSPYMVILGTDEGVHISRDSGATWSFSQQPGVGAVYLSIGNIIFAETLTGNFISYDFGDTWLSQQFPFTVIHRVSNGNKLYYDYFGQQYFKSDAASPLQFTEIPFSPPYFGGKSKIAESDALFVASAAYGTVRLDTTGWRSCTYSYLSPAPTQSSPIEIRHLTSYGDEMYMVGVFSKFRLFHSTDRGLNWQEINAGLDLSNAFAMQVCQTDNRTYLLIARIDDGIRLFSIAHNAASATNQPQKSDLHLQIYPNPTQMASDLHIRLESSRPLGSGSVQVHDAVGRMLIQKQYLHMPSELTIPQWQGFAAGVYFVQIVTETGVVTRKVVIE